MKNIFTFCFGLILFTIGVTKSLNVKAQTISADSLKAQMTREWERAKSYTDEYLQTMPADKYSFKAVDSIRSFAQQMLHLAQANMFFASTATGTKMSNARNLETTESAQTKDSVTYFVNASYDNVINGLKNLSAQKFIENVKAFGGEYPVYIVLMKGFEHQTHHRGQTTIYIRLQGIRPPAERLL